MFYPVQSIRYTFHTTKKIWLDLKKRSFVGASGLLLLGIGILSWISWEFSLLSGLLCAVLAWISIIDLYDRIIPDVLLVGSFLLLFLLYPIPDLIASMMLILILLLAKVSLEKIYKKSLIGWGDIKLMTVCLVFIPLGVAHIFFVLCGGGAFFASLIFRKPYLPFGPFVATAFLYLMMGPF
jgi:Flp pilus assembly protein protease CpaA